jgi:hypothetical protein
MQSIGFLTLDEMGSLNLAILIKASFKTSTLSSVQKIHSFEYMKALLILASVFASIAFCNAVPLGSFDWYERDHAPIINNVKLANGQVKQLSKFDIRKTRTHREIDELDTHFIFEENLFLDVSKWQA